jgi:hypothetical protein
MVFITICFCFVVTRSKLLQLLLLKLGADRNNDGKVDCKDCVVAFMQLGCYQSARRLLQGTAGFEQLEQMEKGVTEGAQKVDGQRRVEERLASLEEKLEKAYELLVKQGKQGTLGGLSSGGPSA